MHTIAAGAGATQEAFSIRIREATLDEHRATEQAPFIRRLLTRRLPIDGYAAMTAQWSFLYAALEDELAAHRDHPALGPFISDQLLRGQALAEDMALLVGPDWQTRTHPLPGTEAYVERLQTLGRDWPVGLLAHHYLRYLGDLSGGQIIARVVRKAYGLEGDAATRFYRFDSIPDPTAFKAAYRERLDDVALDQDERRRVIEEVDEGYRLTARIFDELDRSFGAV